jgi:FtsH-binding integral membrane protein
MMENLRFSRIVRIVAIALLLTAIAELPYGYYTFLRWVVCAISIYTAFLSYGLARKAWLVIFSLVAVLFNPIVPIYLDKGTWIAIDILIAIVTFVSLFAIKAKKKIAGKD